MKRRQILIVVFIFADFLLPALLLVGLGHGNKPSQIVFDTVTGTVEEYRIHDGAGRPVAFVKLEGKETLYRATATYYDALGLHNKQLHAGEVVEITYENNMRGGNYSIVGISTGTWQVSIIDSYLKGWDRFAFFCILLGAGLALFGIVFCIVSIYQFKKLNSISRTDGDVPLDSIKSMAPSYAIKMPSEKGRVIFSKTFDGQEIVVKRTFGATELIVNGMVYAEKKGLIETKYELNAYVKNILIKVALDASGFMYLYANGKLLDEKKRTV